VIGIHFERAVLQIIKYSFQCSPTLVTQEFATLLKREAKMQMGSAITAGAIGTTAITLLHEGARQVIPNSPRVELMGMRGIQKYGLDPLGLTVPRPLLYSLSIAFDLVHNSLGYAMAVGLAGNQNKKRLWTTAILYGLGTGIFTLTMPPLVKIGQQPTKNLKATSAMTIGMYILGGIITAAAFSFFSKNSEGMPEEEIYAAV
jgi:hypothetical protein